MQKVIDQITDQLVGLIDKDRSSYTPQELLKAGIPNYIVERIRLLLEDKVLLDIQKPTSIWIDTEAELFEHAWKDFKTTAFSKSVIPQQELHAIIHHTINDIISVFVEPRKYMAAYLFREDEQLSFDEISKRCSRLTIYKHFGTAIPLYMKKRGLEEISLDRCTKLIANLDARIVASYTAEDWAQKLELLFTLFGGKLDSKLISLFFEDKGYLEAANVFSSLDVPITQSTFIELLSSVPMTVTTTDARETVTSKDQEKPDPLIAEDEEVVPEDNQEENLASVFQSQQPDTEMNEILGDITHEGLVEEDNLEEAKSLNAIFESEEEEEFSDSEPSIPKEEEQEELRSNLSSILGQAKDSYEGVVNEMNSEAEDEIIDEEDLFEEPVDEKFIRPITTFSDGLVEEDELIEDSSEEKVKDSEETESEEEGEEKPMWAQFLSADQMEVMMATRDEQAEPEETSENMNNALYVEDDDDDIVVDEPFEIDTVRMDLSEYLYPNEDRWIKKVFSGKEKAYTNATVYIGGLSSWKEASEFVENEIFSKHKVDMFSEEAIEFIDVLQAYFKEYKS